ncbi:MAG: hypothetical protein ABIN93_18780, partial [Ginsengibacter sp.]
MKKILLLALILFLFAKFTGAQNSSPYWSMAGNSNAAPTSKLGTTTAIPLRLFTNNTERLRIHESGNVGIGTTNPLNILNVKVGGGTPIATWLDGLNSPIFMGMADGVSSEFVLAGASNAASRRAVFQGRRARGTLAAPLVVVNNDYLTSLLSSGYDGTTFQNPATIDFFVDGVPSAGNVPARISFVTGSNVGNRMERLKVGSTGNFYFNNKQLTIIQATGKVGIGTDAPSTELHVIGKGRFTNGLSVDAGGISGTDFNLFGVSGHGAIGVYGTGGATGVYGIGTDYGVFGDGNKYGIYGSSDKGNGVYGITNQVGASAIVGQAKVTNGTGVWGTGNLTGVRGSALESNGTGVEGIVSSADGIGVKGNGGRYGVFGNAGQSGATGVGGQALAADGIGMSGMGGNIGVKGVGAYEGIHGESSATNSNGVVGISQTGSGVEGQGRVGVVGFSDVVSGFGLAAEVSASNAIGVYGYSQYYTGVYGYTAAPSTTFTTTYGGFFVGNVGTTGSYFTVSDRKLKQ